MIERKQDLLSASLQGIWVVIGSYNLVRGREFFDLDFRSSQALTVLSFRKDGTMIYSGSFDSEIRHTYRMRDDMLYLNRNGDGWTCLEPQCYRMEWFGDRLTLIRLGYVEYDDQDKAVGQMQPVTRTVLARYSKQVDWQAEKDKEYKAAVERGVILITLELVEKIVDRLHRIHAYRKERLRRRKETEPLQVPPTPGENEAGQ